MRRVLADENVPAIVVRRLRAAGHDVSRVAPGTTDDHILTQAVREDRVLLTFDVGFGRLALRGNVGPRGGLLLLRDAPAPPAALAETVVALLARTDPDLAGRITTWKRGRLRQRTIASS